MRVLRVARLNFFGGILMKRLFLVLAVLLTPVAALAGMSALNDKDMDTVKGQTGISVDSFVRVNVGSVAWGDSDGFGTYTTQGWLILSNISNLFFWFAGQIDVGGTAGNSYLQYTMGPTPFFLGPLRIGSVIIGSTATATTQDLGEIRISNTTVIPTYIRISGH